MALEVDPKGLRTIGMLTKPDTIEPATHDTCWRCCRCAEAAAAVMNCAVHHVTCSVCGVAASPELPSSLYLAANSNANC
jgi:hypothetical protein